MRIYKIENIKEGYYVTYSSKILNELKDERIFLKINKIEKSGEEYIFYCHDILQKINISISNILIEKKFDDEVYDNFEEIKERYPEDLI